MGPCLFVALLFATTLHSQQQIAAIDFHMPDLSKMSGGKRTLAIGQLARQIRSFSGCDWKALLASELAEADDAG